MESIQSPELLQSVPLPLANETISWPHQNILCLPLFTSREGELSEACNSDDDNTVTLQSPSQHMHSSEDHHKTDQLQSPLGAADPPTSTPSQSPQDLVTTVDNSPTDGRAHQTDEKQNGRQSEEPSLNCLIEPLPRDREALLELRSQLTLELLWIKQAIASRQEVSPLTIHTHSLHNLLFYCSIYS